MLHGAGGMLLTLGSFACRDTAAALTDMLGTNDVWFWSSQQAEKQEFVQWAGRVLEHRCFQTRVTCFKAADGVCRLILAVITQRGMPLYMFADLPCLSVFMIFFTSWGHNAQKVCL